MRVWIGASALLAVAVGCGGSIAHDDGESGGTGNAGGFFTGGAGGSGGTQRRDAGRDARGDAKDAARDYVDDLNCPDVRGTPPFRECDPFAQPNGCAFGDGCYPFVDYPTGPCDKEEYGTICRPPGFGRQGDPCAGGECASGFVCVITGQGNQCVELCQQGGRARCPAGLVCMPIDVEGFGGCF